MKKRIVALALALFAAIAFSQPQTGGFGTGGNTGRGGPSFSSLAFFEFAPASGQGMTPACACTNPTGAKGEALTFTRAGSATCSRQGLATTGIANGDLVVCSADQARVESSGGVLGLRVEGARTNAVLRSQELDNAAWADDSAPVAVITITANAATAPDGTVTAERFEIPARTGIQYSLRRQAIAAGSTGNASVYVRGNGTSGSISLAADGSLATAVDCAYVAATWTRCNLSAIGAWFFVGAITGYGTTSGSKGAQDVFVWGAQMEGSGVATYATSYIPTVAASVTRNEETANIAVGTWPAGGTYSLASSFERSGNVTSTNIRLAVLQQSASVYVDDYFPTNFANFLFDGAFDQLVSSTALSTSGRVASFYDLVNQGACVNGTCQTQAATWTWPSAPVTLRIGCAAASCGTGARPDGIVTRVQADPSSSRAR